MTDRLHLVVREDEKERFRASADRAGLSLSEWVREATREKLARESRGKRLDTVEDLRSFFDECDARHRGEGPEPHWEHHKKVIEASIGSGLSGAEDA
jgi:hypothetical protein